MPAHRKAARGPQTTAPRISRTPSLLDRWPFRRKLNVLVIVPLAVVSAMIAYIVYSEMDSARSAAATARLVRDSAQVTQLIDGVQTEHRQALLVSLRHEAARPGDKASDTSAFLQAQQKVTAQAEAVRATYGDRLPEAEAQALKELEGLDSLRKTIEQGPIPADNIDPAYGSVIEGLINGLGLGQSAVSPRSPRAICSTRCCVPTPPTRPSRPASSRPAPATPTRSSSTPEPSATTSSTPTRPIASPGWRARSRAPHSPRSSTAPTRASSPSTTRRSRSTPAVWSPRARRSCAPRSRAR